MSADAPEVVPMPDLGFYLALDELATGLEPTVLAELHEDGLEPTDDGEVHRTALAIIRDDLSRYNYDLAHQNEGI